MFDKIQHIGYLTSDLEAAVSWFERSFGAVDAGGGPLSPSYAVPSGGRNAYVRFGQAEAEIIEPEDKSGIGSKVLDMHHVGYVVENMEQAADELRTRGFAFGSDEPFVNVFGHQVFYLDRETTNGAFVHLTQLESPAASVESETGLDVERI
ncbi:MAG: VOC family protein, partial [Dehalococcoidia bacterium]|nr:VOC family protein [Dehalococcoidia bacterium]